MVRIQVGQLVAMGRGQPAAPPSRPMVRARQGLALGAILIDHDQPRACGFQPLRSSNPVLRVPAAHLACAGPGRWRDGGCPVPRRSHCACQFTNDPTLQVVRHTPGGPDLAQRRGFAKRQAAQQQQAELAESRQGHGPSPRCGKHGPPQPGQVRPTTSPTGCGWR